MGNLELIFTSCKRGADGKSLTGFQTYTHTEDFPQSKQKELEETIKYTLPIDIESKVDVNNIKRYYDEDRFPINFTYKKAADVEYSVNYYVGRDYTGTRPGNFLSHIFIMQPEGQYNPFLWFDYEMVYDYNFVLEDARNDVVPDFLPEIGFEELNHEDLEPINYEKIKNLKSSISKDEFARVFPIFLNACLDNKKVYISLKNLTHLIHLYNFASKFVQNIENVSISTYNEDVGRNSYQINGVYKMGVYGPSDLFYDQKGGKASSEPTNMEKLVMNFFYDKLLDNYDAYCAFVKEMNDLGYLKESSNRRYELICSHLLNTNRLSCPTFAILKEAIELIQKYNHEGKFKDFDTIKSLPFNVDNLDNISYMVNVLGLLRGSNYSTSQIYEFFANVILQKTSKFMNIKEVDGDIFNTLIQDARFYNNIDVNDFAVLYHYLVNKPELIYTNQNLKTFLKRKVASSPSEFYDIITKENTNRVEMITYIYTSCEVKEIIRSLEKDFDLLIKVCVMINGLSEDQINVFKNIYQKHQSSTYLDKYIEEVVKKVGRCQTKPLYTLLLELSNDICTREFNIINFDRIVNIAKRYEAVDSTKSFKAFNAIHLTDIPDNHFQECWNSLINKDFTKEALINEILNNANNKLKCLNTDTQKQIYENPKTIEILGKTKYLKEVFSFVQKTNNDSILEKELVQNQINTLSSKEKGELFSQYFETIKPFNNLLTRLVKYIDITYLSKEELLSLSDYELVKDLAVYFVSKFPADQRSFDFCKHYYNSNKEIYTLMIDKEIITLKEVSKNNKLINDYETLLGRNTNRIKLMEASVKKAKNRDDFNKCVKEYNDVGKITDEQVVLLIDQYRKLTNKDHSAFSDVSEYISRYNTIQFKNIINLITKKSKLFFDTKTNLNKKHILDDAPCEKVKNGINKLYLDEIAKENSFKEKIYKMIESDEIDKKDCQLFGDLINIDKKEISKRFDIASFSSKFGITISSRDERDSKKKTIETISIYPVEEHSHNDNRLREMNVIPSNDDEIFTVSLKNTAKDFINLFNESGDKALKGALIVRYCMMSKPAGYDKKANPNYTSKDYVNFIKIIKELINDQALSIIDTCKIFYLCGIKGKDSKVFDSSVKYELLSLLNILYMTSQKNELLEICELMIIQRLMNDNYSILDKALKDLKGHQSDSLVTCSMNYSLSDTVKEILSFIK